MFTLGKHSIDSKVVLAPMAGTSDKPFRILAKSFGAGLASSEMVVLQQRLMHTHKSKTRLDFKGEPGIISIQVAATNARELVEYVKTAEQLGADVVDINMGCPAKKVCKKYAGSALLADEQLVEQMLTEAVRYASVPITLKTRIGIDKEHINIATIANIAEQAGIQLLVIHGRTKADKYEGEVDYQSIKEVVHTSSLPIIANGDITTVEEVKYVLDYTHAEAVMIGRGACGSPWIFEYVNQYLQTGAYTELAFADKVDIILAHIKDIYEFYPEHIAKNIAKKHIKWYFYKNGLGQYWSDIAPLSDAKNQYQTLERILTFHIHSMM